MAIGRLGKMLAICAVLATAFLVVSASAQSKARIVRLSEVQGTVKIDRAAGQGFEKAFMNLPVIEGSKLKTGADGRAEVEFEDGSALRLGHATEVVFTGLSLGDAGQKIDVVQLVSGTAYVDLHPKAYGKGKAADQFQLNFGHESLTVPEAAHFRVELDGAREATIAVFKGKVRATGRSGEFTVAEKHTATVDFADNNAAKNDVAKNDDPKNDELNNDQLKNDAKSDDPKNAPGENVAAKVDPAKADPPQADPTAKDTFTIARDYDPAPSDEWDQQQTDYHDRYALAAGASNLSSPYSYGLSDLNYYGSYMNCPGYGFGWQPYFINAGWNPFQDGGWMWYPGSGYTFVSAYPWGWMPYRYGSWALAGGCGWMWQPGSWSNWYAIPPVVNPPRGIVPRPPVVGHAAVMLGKGLSADPAVATPRRLTINPGSAGFGVPRGSVRHLDRFAKTMDRAPRPLVVSTIRPPAPQPMTVFGPGQDPWRGETGLPHSEMGGMSQGIEHHSAAPSAPASHPH